MSVKSKVLKRAKDHGGKVRVDCSQGEEPMRSVLALHGGSSQGVCRTLVMKWMCEDAKGRDFWDWLMPDGVVSAAAVANICIQHIHVGKKEVKETTLKALREQNPRPGRGFREDLEGDAAGMADYLRFYGGLKITQQKFTAGKEKGNVAAAEGGVPGAVGKLVKEESPPNPAYLFVGMLGGASGHAQGVKPEADGSVRFYDPNLGEIQFNTKAGFADWMATVLGTRAYAKYNHFDYDWWD